MKNFSIRKKALAILLSGNIFLTGCSISGELNSKKEETSLESSYSQSSIEETTSILESSQNSKNTIESSLESKNESSKKISEIESSIEESIEISEVESSIDDESMDEDESSIEESTEISEDESSNEESKEISEVENSIEEESTEISKIEVSDECIYTQDGKYIQALDDVNVRSEPNTNSKILSMLYYGNYLKKIGYVNNWYIVDYNGVNAFVSKDFTKEIDEVNINTKTNEYKLCYFPYGSNLYSDKYLNNKIMDVPSLEFGEIFYQDGNAYYVDIEGHNGFVNISSAELLQQPLVVVDESDQLLRFYKNDSKMMEFPVVTGNKTNQQYTPSSKGLFDIKCKNYNARLVGPETNGVPAWDVVVNVFMEYYGGEGIHDAVWRGYFGGDIYQGNGSHGCINCPYNEVMALANEVEVGKTKILIHE